MQDVRVQVYLESLEIDVHESTALFHLLQNGAWLAHGMHVFGAACVETRPEKKCTQMQVKAK